MLPLCSLLAVDEKNSFVMLALHSLIGLDKVSKQLKMNVVIKIYLKDTKSSSEVRSVYLEYVYSWTIELIKALPNQ